MTAKIALVEKEIEYGRIVRLVMWEINHSLNG